MVLTNKLYNNLIAIGHIVLIRDNFNPPRLNEVYDWVRVRRTFNNCFYREKIVTKENAIRRKLLWY